MSKWADKEAAIQSLEQGGKVDPNDLIEAAKSTNHPCHEDFTWDVKTAAAERWRDQARGLIRRVQFEVTVDDVTELVVRYTAQDFHDERRQFRSLPKIRSKAVVGSLIASEVAMLHGLASRVYGIALAKENLISADRVATLRMVRDTLAALKAELEG
jgi:hypothetical protein